MGTITGWTNYPFVELGDTPQQSGPLRECEALTYDGNKYSEVLVAGCIFYMKIFYVFPTRNACLREVNWVSHKWASSLPRPSWTHEDYKINSLPIIKNPSKVVDFLLSILRFGEDKDD